MTVNTLRIVLGDQLNRDSPLLAECGADDLVWMAELPAESTHVWSHKARSSFFISAMRHFAADLRAAGIPLHYHALGEHDWQDFSSALEAAIETLQPQQLAVIEPGDGRVLAFYYTLLGFSYSTPGALCRSSAPQSAMPQSGSD